MNPEATAVHDFWFGPLDADGFCVEDRHRLWFKADAATDAAIRDRFGLLIEQALAGELDDWTAPRERLTLIVLLDQFTRNIFRGTARAFEGDARALALARSAVESGHDRRLAPIERTFAYLPFEHAEDPVAQERCVALFRGLIEELPERLRPRVESSLDYALRHREIIARFGRFPHRNRVLGRASTPAEIAYLEDASTFGQ